MAASSGGIRAGKAFVELSTEDSGVGKGLRAASNKMAAWGASVNKLGGSIGGGVGQAFGAMAKGAKIAGFAIAGIGAGLIGAAKLFADADRETMSDEQAAAADRMKDSFGALMDGASALNNVLMTALQPGIEAVVDVVRMGMNAFRNWVDTHGELLTAVTDFLGGIRDALSAGEIGLAAEIAWSGIKTAWAAGVAWVIEATTDWKTSLQQTMSEAFLGLQQIATNVWANIVDGAISAASVVAKKWEGAVGTVAMGLAKAGEFTGVLPEGTTKMLQEDQSRASAKMDSEMDRKADERRRKRDKAREKAEEDFGQTVIDSNKAIADANNKTVDRAKAELEAKRQELVSLQNKAKELAKPIETGLAEAKKAIDEKGEGEKGSVAGTFGGGRALGQLAGDVSGKSIAENTRETAKNTKKIADSLGGLQPGLAVK